MNKILIFGANGFSGKAFLDYVIENKLDQAYEIVATDRVIPESKGRIRWIEADLLCDNSLESMLIAEKPAYIVNLAGNFSVRHFNELFQLNVGISQRIFETILVNQLKISNILLIGSAAEYGEPVRLPVREDHPLNPVSLYGLTKLFQYQMAMFYYKQNNIPFVLSRTFNILGKGLSEQLSIGSFEKQISQAKDGDSIYVGNIDTMRDFLWINEAVGYYWKLLMEGIPGQVYNVCCGRSVSIRSILDSLTQKSGKNLVITIDQTRFKAHDVADICGDNTKILALFS